MVAVGLVTLILTLVSSTAISSSTDGEGEVLFLGLVVSLIFGGVVVPLIVGDTLAKTLGPTDVDWFKSVLLGMMLLEPGVYFVGWLLVAAFNKGV